MASDDPALVSGNPSFPTTVWSDILSAGDPASPACRERLEKLIRIYWRPAFAYIRAAWRKSIEDAKDLTQAFFAHLLDKDRLSRLRPDRGSFRGFLKHAIRNFLIDCERAESVRRPDLPPISLDAQPGELERLGPASPGEPPERAYDREWFRCLFAAAIAELREGLAREGKDVYFEVFRVYCLEPTEGVTDTNPLQASGSAPTYGEIAKRLGLRETDVANYLHYCRTEAKRILRERIRDYVADDRDVDRELAEAAGE